MTQDPEVDAMGKVAAAIGELEDEAKARVLQWAGQRYGLGSRKAPALATVSTTADLGAGSPDQFEDFAGLFHAADPKIDNYKALIAGYWLQVCEGKPDFEAQPANEALKNLGHGVANITRAFDRLQNMKPAPVRQVQKSGKSKQARKRYRVTAEGIRMVQSMLAGEQDQENVK